MLNAYLQSIKTTQTRNPSEHAYRSSLKHILNDLSMIDEPSNKGKNKIDMEVYTKEGLVSFYIETKMLGFDLESKQYKKQFDRYRKDFQKLIITNFVDFEFYRDGVLVGKCSIADKNTLVEDQQGYQTFNSLLDSFLLDCVKFSNPILLAKKLAEKTRILKNKILENLNSDEMEVKALKDSGNPITKKYKVLAYRDEFKKMLLEDIDNTSFSDLYAQTITYGLFASRYYAYQKDSTTVFTKSQAADFIPTTNPLLKQLFESITLDSRASDFDKSINLVIDDITTILANTNMATIIEKLKAEKSDIVIHFYETFLEHYDRELRKSMGVWYTPTEVVDYVVKGVDGLLKSKFNILKGISSDEKQDYTFSKNVRKADGSFRTENITKKGIHRVQVLDPAVGTGNFLNATIKHIKSNFDFPSFWKDYVNQDLIPRLNGFELMMPSYVMAHMKMYELLKDDLDANSKRFNVFLTNTLYGNIDTEQTLLSASDLIYQLNEEVSGANRVRREQPVMVVMGNPPYNGNSKNNGTFISNLMNSYYPEENIGKGLNDDYIKFIRYGQHLIDQNANGILAYVSNNSFIHSIACSKMRRSLLKSFDEIYILNLHGDKDENVFNIKTPISISFFVKTNEKAADELGKVFYHEIKGTEDSKISYCRHGSIDEAFKQVEFGSDDCFFYPQDVDLADTYNNTNTTFDLDQLFEIKTVGVLTQSDTLVLDTNADRLVRKVSAYKENNILPDSPSDHLKSFDHKTLIGSFENAENKKNMLEYRPFDDRFFYDSNVVARSKKKLNAHASIEGNVFFNFTHTCLDDDFRHVFFTEKTPECKLFKGARSTHTAPLFVYAETPNTTKNGALFTSSETKSNINQSVFNKFQMVYGNIKPLDVLDYVYGVLNDADYVSTYNELLKSNYPRVPYPQTKEELDRFAEKGARLRQVHLEKKKTDTLSTYQAVENNTIEKVEYDEANQRIWFNNDGYFDHITKEMWAYKIGAVNPLASWLEARCKAKDVFDRQMVGVYQNVIYRVRNSI